MISFYPGPSRIYDKVLTYMKDAYSEGIMSINHRSPEFMDIVEKTVSLLKLKLGIPEEYRIIFTSSATECWEIIAQSLVTTKSYHIYNGAFGKKWFDYTSRIHPDVESMEFDPETLLEPQGLIFNGENEVICLTQNETSNGTQVSNDIIRSIKQNNPQHLIAVDATSSMAGILLDFSTADIWLGSVQKCFGLPAGLGLMICSPATLQLSKKINEKNHYNSLNLMIEMMERWQTSYTPNVLGIYLLMRMLRDRQNIDEVHKKTIKRYHKWEKFCGENDQLQFLIKNKETRSSTVLTFEGDRSNISAIKKKASKKGFLLGEGYGDLKNNTFRIANFPAIRRKEIEKLMQFFKSL